MRNQLLFTQQFFLAPQSFISGRIKSGLAFFFITLCAVTLHAQNCPPNIQWEKSYGGSQDDASSSVLVTSDGGYVMAGYTASNDSDVSGNHGNEDSWVVKLAADNSITWQRSLGGPHADVAHAIVQTTDDGYVLAGYTHSDSNDVSGNHGQQDFWVVKLDANGNLIWQNALGGSDNEIAFALSQTSDGGYIVGGLTYSNDSEVTGNHGGSDYWIVKLDANGALTWQKTFGGTADDGCYSVRQTTDGGYIVAGFTTSNDGDVSFNHGLNDYWVLKLDAAGAITWQKSYGGPADDVANCIRQTNDGGYIIAGYTNSVSDDVTSNHGNSDYWIVKINSTGTIEWQKSLGGQYFEEANAIEQTADGGYVTVGNTTSNNGNVNLNHGGIDYWIVKQDANGALLWQKTLGGTANDGGLSIKETADTGFIVSGYSASINDDVTGNHGSTDFWVVKLYQAPNALITYYADMDSDGYGDPNNSVTLNVCIPPAGYVTDNNDCNDADTSIHPNATEVCNGIDDNCNNIIDDGVIFTTYYADADGDSYGDPSNPVTTCNGAPAGFVIDGTDCNDADPAINPGATEVCNGIDDNCNGETDDGVIFTTYYADADGDSYGDPSTSASTCSGEPAGYVVDGTDCNDANPAIHPGATEVCNGIDDDCNSLIDDGLIFTTYHIDADGDTYGNPLVFVSTCNGQPAGYVTDSTDCDDSNPNVHPGAIEIPNNGIDDNCNGVIDEFGVGVAGIGTASSFSIFPNPATSIFTLQLQLLSTSNFNASITITSVIGEVVFEKISSSIKGRLYEEISLNQNFAEGMYYVKVNDGQQQWVKPLVVIK